MSVTNFSLNAARLRRYLYPVATVISIVAALYTVLFAFNIYARQTIIQNFTHNIRTGNINELTKRTDWDNIRSNLNEYLVAQSQTKIGQYSGFNIGEERIKALVNYYVRPINLPTLLYYHSLVAEQYEPTDFIRNVKILGYDSVEIELAYPPQEDRPWIEKLEPVRATFRLQNNNRWTLSELDAPLYLVPREAPTLIAGFENGKENPLGKDRIKSMAEQAAQDLKAQHDEL